MRSKHGYISEHTKELQKNNQIAEELFDLYGVKRGLRDKNGNGVLAGLTNISMVIGAKVIDGEKHPCEGELYYRGYSIYDLTKGFSAKGRYGAEECAYLILFGDLPDGPQLERFKSIMAKRRTLPTHFVRDVVMKAPGQDIMNSLTKSVLTLASYDPHATENSLDNVLRQSIMLTAVLPMLAVYGYHAYNHEKNGGSLYIHNPDVDLSMAENILMMLRPDQKYTNLEAHVLDLALVLHMEHGGGNNSAFTTHVVTSAGSDTYAVIAAALCSLKGSRHGGANIKVIEMMEDLKANVSDPTNREEVRGYLVRLLDGEAYDHKGLIYGMGHAVYSLSDPRAVVFKSFVEKLAHEKGRDGDYNLYALVEELATEIICQKRKIYKGVCANVDFYSGFVYSMLGIPKELFTPLFAMARIVGWSAHRLEELTNNGKIIRPAYKCIAEQREYHTLDQR